MRLFHCVHDRGGHDGVAATAWSQRTRAEVAAAGAGRATRCSGCTACAARRKWRRRGRRAAKRALVCAPNFRVLDQIRQRQIMEGGQVRRDIFNDGGTNQTFLKSKTRRHFLQLRPKTNLNLWERSFFFPFNNRSQTLPALRHNLMQMRENLIVRSSYSNQPTSTVIQYMEVCF